jgi:hypothetical protein
LRKRDVEPSIFSIGGIQPFSGPPTSSQPPSEKSSSGVWRGPGNGRVSNRTETGVGPKAQLSLEIHHGVSGLKVNVFLDLIDSLPIQNNNVVRIPTYVHTMMMPHFFRLLPKSALVHFFYAEKVDKRLKSKSEERTLNFAKNQPVNLIHTYIRVNPLLSTFDFY